MAVILLLARLAGAALHAARPDRPRHHAERRRWRRRWASTRRRVYAVTFAVGAALTGLAGGLLAPLSGVVPTIGAAYIAKAFITVISGGAAILSGTAIASALLGAINVVATFAFTSVLGEVALLVAAVVLLRLLPQGITGRFFRRAL